MKWKVPFIDLSLQFKNSEQEITEEFKRVMNEGSFILRNDVEKFENNMALYLGVKHVIGVNSGTDALSLSVEVAGIKEGDEVITVAHTFIATIAAIVHRKAKPILVDIKDDFNMDMEEVEKAITSKTKAIIPVHLNGRICDMGKVMELAQKHNLIIIEDACQSLGSLYKGKKAGSFGLAGCFSTHPLKTLSCAGDGGFISTNNDEIAEKIRYLRNHGQKTRGDIFDFGYNSRLDNLHAALLNIKFKLLDNWIKRRREIASIYSKRLADLPLILPPSPSPQDFFDTYNSYVIRTSYHQELIDFLKLNGIEIFSHFSKPLYHNQKLNLLNYHLPLQEKICKEILSLPIYPELTNEQVEYVIETIHKFFKNKK